MKGRKNTRPESFFESALAAYNQVREYAEIVERNFEIGGYRVKLQFGGEALLPIITPALEHLTAETSGNANFTICLWDSESTGIRMPRPPWKDSAYLARGVIQGFNNETFHTSFHAGSNILSLVDFSRNLAIFWTPSASEVPYYEIGAPLRAILQAWMSRNNRQLTHAAAVGSSEGAVLLVGRGGSGKSTTAVACLQSPLKYISDDYCLISTSGPARVFSLYNTAKLDAKMLKRFPNLFAAVRNKNELIAEKALLFIHHKYPDKLKKKLPLKAILLPRVTGKDKTHIMEVSAAEALAGLAPSTIFQLPGAGRETFQAMARLARELPSMRLELGLDFEEIPKVIGQALLEVVS